MLDLGNGMIVSCNCEAKKMHKTSKQQYFYIVYVEKRLKKLNEINQGSEFN